MINSHALYRLSYGGITAKHPIGCLAYVGVFLFFQIVTNQVSSALLSLTSVFGMGTGGPSASSTPTLYGSLSPYILNILFFLGDSCGNRTRVTGVRGRCLNRLTNEPFSRRLVRVHHRSRVCTLSGFGAPSGIRTRDTLIKSQVLYQLS